MRIRLHFWPLGILLPLSVLGVSWTVCGQEPLVITSGGRAAFIRGEVDAERVFTVENRSGVALHDVQATIEQTAGARPVSRTVKSLGMLADGAAAEVVCGIETRLRPGWRSMRVTVNGRDSANAEVKSSQEFALGIGPKAGDRMMVLMWEFNAPPKALGDFGFTHALTKMQPSDDTLATYDNALVAGVALAHKVRCVYPGGKPDSRYQRTTRDGMFYTSSNPGAPPVAEISNPEFLEAMKPVVAANVAAAGAHPACVGVLPQSEARDSTFPSFTTEHLRYRTETGRDVPREVRNRTFGWDPARKRYPGGLVPDDDPILAYYRWFWKGGDGWPGFSGGVAREYHRLISKPGFFAFWDPAVRCPPIWGSGGDVDMINHWAYAVPEPMNVAGPAEEILAMAAGRPGQKVSIMTQLICYRKHMAPVGKEVTPVPEWLERRPNAGFPTIPPDTLQEATWSMIAKPVNAIMYHGWETVYETGRTKGYVYTNPESAVRLRHLLRDVVAPLGPTLKRLGRKAPPVAVFESFTTSFVSGPTSWGWREPALTFLQRARLDPQVVFEESILAGELADVKVLYAPQCAFLTPAVVKKIREFQSCGGILVADNQLLPALKADIEVPVVSFAPPPESELIPGVDEKEASREGDTKTRLGTMRTKAAMHAQAADLRQRLAPHFTPVADSSSPEIVVYSRQWRGVAYLFAINDRRTFGDYVGPWGMTMENGLPFEGEVSRLDDGTVAAVYELSRGGEVAFDRRDGKVVVPVKFDTNDGRLFVFLPEKIASVTVEAPPTVKSGEVVSVKFSALDAGGQPVQALLPGEIRLYDAAGRELDGAGWVCLEGGTATVEIATNLDDAPGDYRLVCRDRASGKKIERIIRSIR